MKKAAGPAALFRGKKRGTRRFTSENDPSQVAPASKCRIPVELRRSIPIRSLGGVPFYTCWPKDPSTVPSGRADDCCHNNRGCLGNERGSMCFWIREGRKTTLGPFQVHSGVSGVTRAPWPTDLYEWIMLHLICATAK